MFVNPEIVHMAARGAIDPILPIFNMQVHFYRENIHSEFQTDCPRKYRQANMVKSTQLVTLICTYIYGIESSTFPSECYKLRRKLYITCLGYKKYFH